MKAALLHQLGQSPQYGETPVPTPENDDQVLITPIASGIKQLDLIRATGRHYMKYATMPAVVGVDGVGRLADGRLVYAMGLTGMMAGQALVAKNRWVELPPGLDENLAALLPNALIGADAAMTLRGKLQPGQTVLINGATGATGMMAVQAARFHGAARVIALGRDAAALENLKTLGADETISLKQPDEAVIAQITEAYRQGPIDLILDYLWGHPTELLLTALAAVDMPRPLRLVTIGQVAGATVPLASSLLRSRPVEIVGSGFGGITQQEMGAYMQNQLPAMFRLAAEGGLTLTELEIVPLAEVEQAWGRAGQGAKRIVVRM